MRWTHVCPLIGLALFACATAENEDPLTPSLTSGGSADEAGSSGNGGSASGGTNSKAGSSSGGTFSPVAGSASVAGFSSSGGFGTSGSNSGGAGGTSGGTAGAGTGGNANGGAAGKANGGAAGAGGSGANPQCVGITIPAKTGWKGAAFEASNDFLPAKVFDGDDTTRYATGDPQDGDEWLEIDFGEIVTLNEVTMHTHNDDYFRHYELRLSNKEQDLAAPVLSEGDGMKGTIVVPLAEAHAGRYLNIRQTGKVSPTWWSLHEVSVACK
jgi:hypothetical protein